MSNIEEIFLVDFFKNNNIGFIFPNISQRFSNIGLDIDPTGGAFGSSLPIDLALDPQREVIIAFKMNNKPLTRDHGFPLRIIIPGSIGARQVKWLGQLCIQRRWAWDHFRSHFFGWWQVLVPSEIVTSQSSCSR
ncbi:hypothetical protein MS3_00001922 [Schistosoma haematobium]|uniref:Oxidoreductase molybdopterin-binding domain-containing protein n=1 Tax=Schistosoma haematobium TaxID=6185 RepID=A0A922LY28_SCHHA|nr:hypothetical protein MS3_00001922 [Schistosoma haematobium]KAH9596125.1 hypothetical protein MS3_00001922 [Schistosoma haematobium]